MLKKLLLSILILIFLSVPLIRTNYYIEGQGEITKRVSIATLIIDDFKEGTVGTMLYVEKAK